MFLFLLYKAIQHWAVNQIDFYFQPELVCCLFRTIQYNSFTINKRNDKRLWKF